MPRRGECQQVPVAQIGPELFDVTRRDEEFVAHRDELTVFDSTGWAVEDDVALRLAIELVAIHGVGAEVQLEYLPADPYDPCAVALSTES